MSSAPAQERPLAGWWIERGLRPLIIAAMTACLAMPFVSAVQAALPGWRGAYFLAVAFAASLEGALAERPLRRLRLSGWEYLAARAAEVGVLLIGLKLASYLPLGLAQLQADLLRWPPDPFRLVRPLDLLTGAFLILLWVPSIQVARLVIELDEAGGRGPPPPDRTSVAYYLWETGPRASEGRDRQAALERLGELFLWGGVAMLLGLAVLRGLLDRARDPSLYALFLYFALGVGLLSQARFSVARAAWQDQGVPVQASVGRRWLLWAVLFLAGVTALALLLPVGYAARPLLVLRGSLLLVLDRLMFAVTWLFFLLTLPLTLLLAAIRGGPRPEPPAAPSPFPQPEVGPPIAPWLPAVGQTLFWVLLVAALAYALLRTARDRVPLLAGMGRAAGGAWQRFWRWLGTAWRRRGGRGLGVAAWLERRRRGGPGQPAPGPAAVRFFSLRRLTPRELVRYFYLSAARRAAEAGQPRRPGQTPYEYRADLERRFPDLEPDLDGLTDAFVRARYGCQPVAEADAQAVRPLWQRIKAALRRRRARSA